MQGSSNHMGCTHCGDLEQTESNIEANPMLSSTLTQQIHEYPVLVYSDSRSQECTQLKELLRDYGIKFEYFEVDRMSKGYSGDPNLFGSCIAETSGVPSLPVLYVGGSLVGGLPGNPSSELRTELETGRLHSRLRSLNAFGRTGKRYSLS